MDARFFANPASNAFKNLRNSICLKGPEKGPGYATDTVLRLDSPGSLNCSISTSKGVKRKWSLRDGSMDMEAELPLCLWLGHSSSSSDSKASSATGCTSTTSSTKETDEEASMDLELDFSLHLGGEKAPPRKKISSSNKLSLDLEDQVDLELSLLSTPAESDFSTVQLNTSEKIPPTVGGDLYMNEGSISSHLRTQSPFPLLQSSENTKRSCFLKQAPSSSIVTVPTSSVTCLSGIAQQQQRNSITKMCQFDGCEKGARGASGRCIAHGGGRRCQKPDCHKGSEGRTAYCKAHGGGRRCEFLGCTKSAEGHTDYCIAHGGGRRCSHTACTRAARGKSGLCIRHGGGKRCQMENCTKSAEGISGLCISHGGGRRCQVPDCTKGAQGSTMYCKAHGGGKRCTFEGCNKGAEGSTPYCKGHGGGKRCTFDLEGGACPKSVHGGTLFCVAHGGGKRCVVPDCTRSARGRTDCCVRHGGGKRCKFEGCAKSAQGSTDFCKAHGGGKRCSWGDDVCNLFARGKTGMCTSHDALVQDNRVHGGATIGTLVHETVPNPSGEMEKLMTTDDMNVDAIMASSSSCLKAFGVYKGSVSVSVPEGRVHGGSLIALLAV
ncbi:hypothetical protein Ccrd_007982 [Cynara cardunculus var. scolymus]|uniref:WRKY19-like zinc finger domain-containing protein n=1 Tax=Cynara cardunculus var. scolymus TaxID=59895 RepID=A0A118JSZ4_CYNCS|nr:hypothetical protein Ccrd_007982 [Cynara cardunculus var. scolymus]